MGALGPPPQLDPRKENMAKLPRRFFAILPDGLHKVTITQEFIGPQTKLLETIAKSTPKVTLHIIPGTHMMNSNTGMAFAREIEGFDLHTYFKPTVDSNNKAIIQPVWSAPGSEMKCSWKALPDMKLFFVSYFELADGADARSVEPLHYLIARDNKKRTYLLPIPNLHNDGRVCMGNGAHFVDMKRSPLEMIDMAMTSFLSSKWNADLAGNITEATNIMFRFDTEGKQIFPDREKFNWERNCRAINNYNYEFVGKLP